MKKSKKNNENNVKEPTKTPSEKRGDRAAEKIADKVERIQQELTSLRFRKYHWYINAYEKTPQELIVLNSEKKRRDCREEMLENELAKANEQLILKAQLEQSDNC